MLSQAATLASIIACHVGRRNEPRPKLRRSFRAIADLPLAAGRASQPLLGMGIGGVVFSVLALAGADGPAVAVRMALSRSESGRRRLSRLYRLPDLDVVHASLSRFGDAGSDSRAIRPKLYHGAPDAAQQPKDHCRLRKYLCGLAAEDGSAWAIFALPIGVFAVEAGWYTIVALAFSARRPRRLYLAAKTLDRSPGWDSHGRPRRAACHLGTGRPLTISSCWSKR